MSEPTGYETLDEAVYHAAQATRQKYGNTQEALSVVYEKSGRYFFLDPVSEKKSGRHVKATVTIPEGGRGRFLVHNHPSGHENEKFSDDDIANSERFKVPSAIIYGVEKPTIRVYTPGKTSVDSVRRGARTTRSSVGDEFAFAPPEVAPPAAATAPPVGAAPPDVATPTAGVNPTGIAASRPTMEDTIRTNYRRLMGIPGRKV